MKSATNGTQHPFAGYPMWEILMVGGQTQDGKDATNELSYVCLEAANQLKTTQPVMAVRVWEGDS